MDRDAGESDRRDESQQGDTGMLGSEAEEPGPGRDTSLTDPDPAAASTDQPRATVAMSEGDPMRTRLGSHIEGAGVIGFDVAAAEEGTTQETPPEDRPGYESERSTGAGLAGEPVVGDTGAYERDARLGAPVGDAWAEDAGPADPSAVTRDTAVMDRSVYEDETVRMDESTGSTAGYEGEPGGAGMAGYEGEPGQDVPATYTGEESDVAGRPEYADRAEGSDRPLYQEEPQRADRSGGGGSLFSEEEPELLDRPGPQEPGVDEGVYDQDADQAREQRPSDGR